MKRLLLLSNSTMKGQPFLQWPLDYILDVFEGKVKKVLFVPFAGVTFGFDEYTALVADRLGSFGVQTVGAHTCSNPDEAVQDCDAILVGGGNTWQLTNHLHQGWMQVIRRQVEQGTPYIGWSAGANVACPTIKTTNDMPIVQPPRFEALGLVDFQINPHYTEASLPDHGGETRPERIREFLTVNTEATVMGLPEGSLLDVRDDRLLFQGKGPLKIFTSEGVRTQETPGPVE